MEKIVELDSKPKKVKKKFGFGLRFLSELKAEFRKLSWTPKKELLQFTKIVVAFIFIFGFGIYFVDLAIRGGLSWLDFLVHRIFG